MAPLTPIKLFRGEPANELVESFSGFTDFAPPITTPVLEILRSGGRQPQPPLGPISLMQFGGAFDPSRVAIVSLPLPADAQQLELPNLGLISSDFAPTLAAVTNLQFDLLEGVGGDFAPIVAAAVAVNLGALTYVDGDFAPQAASLVVLNLPQFSIVGGKIAPAGALLTSVLMANIFRVGGDIDLSGCPSLTTIGQPSQVAQIGGDVLMTGCALPQADVDATLVMLASLDGTGSTTSYDGHNVDLSGGTSAAPSATGLAAKVTLVGRGNTVTTN